MKVVKKLKNPLFLFFLLWGKKQYRGKKKQCQKAFFLFCKNNLSYPNKFKHIKCAYSVHTYHELTIT